MWRKPVLLFFLVLASGWLFSLTAHAETCTGATCTYTATATEPSTKVGGAPLDNLKQIVLTPKLNGVTQAPVVIPATKPSGGGTVTKQLTITPAVCAVTTLSVDMQAENTLGAKGPAISASRTKDLTLDPTCAPSQGAFSLD